MKRARLHRQWKSSVRKSAFFQQISYLPFSSLNTGLSIIERMFKDGCLNGRCNNKGSNILERNARMNFIESIL